MDWPNTIAVIGMSILCTLNGAIWGACYGQHYERKAFARLVRARDEADTELRRVLAEHGKR